MLGKSTLCKIRPWAYQLSSNPKVHRHQCSIQTFSCLFELCFYDTGLHGFTDKGTIFPSPIGLSATFNPSLISAVSNITAFEAEGLGISHMFAPVLDLSRELRWGRVEENWGEDPFLTGEMGAAFIGGLQNGTRRGPNVKATKRMAATCKHFAAFGSPQGGL